MIPFIPFAGLGAIDVWQSQAQAAALQEAYLRYNQHCASRWYHILQDTVRRDAGWAEWFEHGDELI